MGRRIFLIILTLALSPLVTAGTVLCRQVFANIDTGASVASPLATENIEKFEQIFTRSRGVGSYGLALGSGFQKILQRIANYGGHWIDAGAGDAFAVQQFLNQNRNPNIRATAISLQSAAVSGDRLKVMKDRYIEQIPDHELSKADLITDLFGPIAYSAQPHLILKKYLELLKDDGQVFLFLGSRDELFGSENRVITGDGKYLNLAEWIQQLPGVGSELIVDRRDDDGMIVEKWTLRLWKSGSEPFNIPEVEVREFKEGAPPRMLFQEKVRIPDQATNERLGLRQLAISAVQKQAERMNFSRFMDSFRSGELTHPLLAEISRLGKGDKWANVSFYGENLIRDIERNQYDKKNTEIFVGFAQQLMAYRLGNLSAEKLRYTQVLPGTFNDRIEVGRPKLITDFEGEFATETTPDLTLNKYLAALKPEGSVFIFLGPEYTGFGVISEVLTRDGKRVSLRKWLQNLESVDVNFYRGGYSYTGGEWTFVKIRKKGEHFDLPQLELLGGSQSSSGELPRLIFQEVSRASRTKK